MHLMRGCVAALFGQRCGVCSQAVLRGVGSLRLAAAPPALAGWNCAWGFAAAGAVVGLMTIGRGGRGGS
jgi:hypothetical protein